MVINDPTDNDIDELMKTLYPSGDILEEMCATSYSSKYAVPEKKIEGGDDADLDRSAEEVVQQLPQEYFTEDYDPLGSHLEEVSSWGDDNLIERFMNKIEATDTDKDVIIGLMTSMIDANYDELMECTRKVGVIESDLCRAGIQVNNGRRNIRSAMEVIRNGAVKINALQAKRQKVLGIAETIKSLKAVKDIHKAMLNSITTGEVGKAAEFARSVVECLRTDSFDSFSSLKSIGESMQKNICTIRQKTDKALNRLCCRKFTSLDYENIVRSYLILDYLSESMKISLHSDNGNDADDDDAFYYDSTGCMDGLAQRVTRFQLEDIDACLHSSVMEYIYSSQQKKQQAAEELAVAGSFVPMQLGDIVDLTEIPLKLLYRRLPSELVAPCVTRTCELLADVIHTHFLVTQWHNAPFDAQNHDWKFLHRRTVDPQQDFMFADESEGEEDTIGQDSKKGAGGFNFDEESDENENNDNEDERDSDGIILYGKNNSNNPFGDEIDETIDLQAATGPAGLVRDTPKTSGSSKKLQRHLKEMNRSQKLSESVKSSILLAYQQQSEKADVDENTSRLVRLNGVKLAITHQNLIQSRTLLWEELLKALVDMLNITSITSAVKTDDFLAMICALNAMVGLGREFSGSESKTLKLCIERKSSEYLQNYHKESFQMNRLLIDNENWMNVPVNLASRGGILGIIETNVSRDIQVSSALSPSQSRLASYVQTQLSSSIGARPRTETELSANASIADFSPRNRTSSLATSSVAEEEITTPSSAGRVAENANGNTVDETTAGAMSGALSLQHESIFQMFCDLEGASPFHFGSKASVSKEVSSEELAYTSRSENGADQSSLASASAAVTEDGFLTILRDLIAASAAAGTSRRAMEQSSSMVVTQSALNGMTKYVAKYLHLMYIMPTLSAQIFACIRQLFDFYMCAVFYGFVPNEEKNKFLAKPTKMNSTAPDQSKDFEVIYSYIEHTMKEYVLQLFSGHTEELQEQQPSNQEGTGEDDEIPNDSTSSAGHESSTTGGDGAMESSGFTTRDSSSNNNVQQAASSSSFASSSSTSPLPKPENSLMSPVMTPSRSFNNASGIFSKDGTTTTTTAISQTTNSSTEQTRGGVIMSSLLSVPMLVAESGKENCFALNERIVAAESCCFVAKILDDVQSVLKRLLAGEGRETLKACMEYISSMQIVASQLRSLVYKSICPVLLKQTMVRMDCSFVCYTCTVLHLFN